MHLLVGSVLAIGLSEGALRLIGFEFDTDLKEIEFGWPDPEKIEFSYRPDPEVFWMSRNHAEALGVMKAGKASIVFVGDSCTEFGTYPTLVEEQLADKGRPVAGQARVAASGWSSYQGVRAFERDVVPYAPAVATFYFGWNDHWVGFGVEDADIAGLRYSGPDRLESLRLVQLFVKVRMALYILMNGQRPARVSLADYQENLSRAVRSARAAGVVPVLFTAPSNHKRGNEPGYLEKRHLVSSSDLIDLHQAYVRVTREVAEAEGADLCDLEERLLAWSEEERNARFRADGIHFAAETEEFLAAEIVDCFLNSDRVMQALDAAR